jgi:bifunctional DNase/RNase
LTHDLFKKLADQFNIVVIEVMIYKLEEGVFFSKLICNNGEKEYSIDSRTSDAVAIALRFGCPIYITEEILEKAQITNTPSDSVPSSPAENVSQAELDSKYGSNTDEELYKMIDEAVKKEDYEHAAAIRDEIEKRKKRRKD